jgi:hypothetical protein
MPEALPVHPDVQPLAFLLGSWRGAGKGEYPTIPSFEYEEEIRLWHVGKPMLLYTQRTVTPADGILRHSEMGYWRPAGPGRLEIVMAHPTGIVEIQEGTISEEGRIEVSSSLVGLTSTAKEVTKLERSFELRDGVLAYELRMAAVGQPLQRHLTAELRREG